MHGLSDSDTNTPGKLINHGNSLLRAVAKTYVESGSRWQDEFVKNFAQNVAQYILVKINAHNLNYLQK
jgi:glycine cleavage system regulatory protein